MTHHLKRTKVVCCLQLVEPPMRVSIAGLGVQPSVIKAMRETGYDAAVLGALQHLAYERRRSSGARAAWYEPKHVTAIDLHSAGIERLAITVTWEFRSHSYTRTVEVNDDGTEPDLLPIWNQAPPNHFNARCAVVTLPGDDNLNAALYASRGSKP